MSEDLVQQVLKMMTEEQKAELISKLSKTDELRDVNKVRQETQPPQETRAPDDFTMTREKPKQNSTQVEVKKRENLFTDDGVEHKDEQNVTPQISLTERKRPPVKKVSQTCSSCNKTSEVHPTHKRENFICDSCLRARSV